MREVPSLIAIRLSRKWKSAIGLGKVIFPLQESPTGFGIGRSSNGKSAIPWGHERSRMLDRWSGHGMGDSAVWRTAFGAVFIRESGARLLRACGGDDPSAAACQRPRGRVHGTLGFRGLSRPEDRSTWPLSLIAGNRAKTLGARFYADSKPSPPRPRAELSLVSAVEAQWLCGRV